MTSTISIIIDNFYFLVKEYNFYIVLEQYSPEIMGNAEVIYKSEKVMIRVVVDRSQVLLNIGEPSWPDRDWLDFSDVLHYFNANIESVYDFQKNNLNKPPDIGTQLQKLAILLKQYCEPILKGDFSMSTEIRKIETKRISEMVDSFRKFTQKPSQ